MGDREQRLTAQQQQQQQLQQQQLQQRPGEAMKGLLPLPEKAPTASQALTVVTLFPAGGLLLVLSGLALVASVVGLAVTAPVFLLFSPVLVPAALLLGLAVAGFLTSGALGLGGLSSLSCLADTVRCMFHKTPDYVEQAKRRMAEAGHRAKEAGHTVQSKAHEGAGKA